MAKGREKIEARRSAIGLLGKSLARRAQRKCELCEASDGLHPYDLNPSAEPELESLLLLCARCTELVGGATPDPRTLRFLEGAVWSEVEPIARVAKECLSRVDAPWARDTMEMF